MLLLRSQRRGPGFCFLFFSQPRTARGGCGPASTGASVTLQKADGEAQQHESPGNVYETYSMTRLGETSQTPPCTV